MRRAAGIGVAGVLIAVVCLAGGVREVEISYDPPARGQQIYTVRLRPDLTCSYDKILFECVLHQEFQWAVTNEQKRIKIHEPAIFTFRRPDVKLVDDLDCFISFRVPVALEKLKEIYGLTAFRTNVPVTVSRMKISGIVSNQPLWVIDTPAAGFHKVADLAPGADEKMEAGPKDVTP